jgi:hypothetical protein
MFVEHMLIEDAGNKYDLAVLCSNSSKITFEDSTSVIAKRQTSFYDSKYTKAPAPISTQNNSPLTSIDIPSRNKDDFDALGVPSPNTI